MKGLRFLLLGIAICFVCGVKAQFYDSANEICYYVTYENDQYTNGALVFNFDGKNGCILNQYQNDEGNYLLYTVDKIKSLIKEKPTFFEDQIEVGDYRLSYTTNNTYSCSSVYKDTYYDSQLQSLRTVIYNEINTYQFSSDRSILYYKCEERDHKVGITKRTYKRVDKSYFKLGRSRTPSGIMHE